MKNIDLDLFLSQAGREANGDEGVAMELFKSMANEGSEAAKIRESFAAAFEIPLNQDAAAQSTIRQIFRTDESVANGQNVNYPIETGEVRAYYLPRKGAVPQNFVDGDELFVPGFDIATSVEFNISFVRNGRYDVVARQMERLRNAIINAENVEGWRLINAAINGGSGLEVDNGDTSLTKSFVNTLVKEFAGQEGYSPDLMVVSPVRAGDFRDWSDTDVDPQTRREIYKNAGVGNIWGVDIMQSHDVADDEVFMFDTKKMGVMPLYYGLTIQDDPSAITKLRMRFVGWENVGMAVLDPNAIRKGVITTSDGEGE